MIGSSMFSWTPTLLDSIFPFSLGLVQFALVNAVRQGTAQFLTLNAIFWAAAIIGYINEIYHASRGEKNRSAYQLLRRYLHFARTVAVIGVIVSLALIWIDAINVLGDVVLVSLALVLILPLLVNSIANWLAPLNKIHRDRRVT